MWQGIHDALEGVARRAVLIAGMALLTAAALVSVDVLCRKFLSLTVSGSDEISGYVFAAGTTWAYSYALLHRSNVRIDAVYNLLPLWLRAVLDVVGVSLLLFYMGIQTHLALGAFIESWEGGSVSVTTLATPLWIPQLFWVLGLILFMITLIFVAIFSLAKLLAGDYAAVNVVAGVLSVDDEVEEEMRGLDLDGKRV
ncbi:MAG: TRAP transporter small permease [Alphaproteobacteria bacterium]